MAKTLAFDKNNCKVRTFNEVPIRTIWHEKKGKWFFCLPDVITAAACTNDQKDYLKKLRKRDPDLQQNWDKLVTFLQWPTAGGIQPIKFASAENVLRIIKVIPEEKTANFKTWIEKIKPKA